MELFVRHITSLEIPDLAPYRTLKRPEEHQKQGIFVGEGEKVVRRLVESPLDLLSILLTPEWLDVYRPLLEKRSGSPDVFIAAKSLMEEIVGFQLHKGIMAIGRIPRGNKIETLLAKSPHPRLLVAADGIMNSENMGVIIRNCASMGVQGLLAGETACDPYMRRSVRNSMGNVFSLPIVYLSDMARELHEMSTRFGIKLVAANPREGSKLLEEVDLSEDCCIVLGSEGDGISPRVAAVCDESVVIPMAGGVDSINVGSASAVLLYEARRQRGSRRYGE